MMTLFTITDSYYGQSPLNDNEPEMYNTTDFSF